MRCPFFLSRIPLMFFFYASCVFFAKKGTFWQPWFYSNIYTFSISRYPIFYIYKIKFLWTFTGIFQARDASCIWHHFQNKFADFWNLFSMYFSLRPSSDCSSELPLPTIPRNVRYRQNLAAIRLKRRPNWWRQQQKWACGWSALRQWNIYFFVKKITVNCHRHCTVSILSWQIPRWQWLSSTAGIWVGHCAGKTSFFIRFIARPANPFSGYRWRIPGSWYGGGYICRGANKFEYVWRGKFVFLWGAGIRSNSHSAHPLPFLIRWDVGGPIFVIFYLY